MLRNPPERPFQWLHTTKTSNLGKRPGWVSDFSDPTFSTTPPCGLIQVLGDRRRVEDQPEPVIEEVPGLWSCCLPDRGIYNTNSIRVAPSFDGRGVCCLQEFTACPSTVRLSLLRMHRAEPLASRRKRSKVGIVAMVPAAGVVQKEGTSGALSVRIGTIVRHSDWDSVGPLRGNIETWS